MTRLFTTLFTVCLCCSAIAQDIFLVGQKASELLITETQFERTERKPNLTAEASDPSAIITPVVASMIVLLANDVYFRYVQPFQKFEHGYHIYSYNWGYSAGLRKKFKSTHLEVGFLHVNEVAKYKEPEMWENSISRPPPISPPSRRTTFQASFLAHVLRKQTPDAMEPYIGITYNRNGALGPTHGWGFGGLIGAEYQIMDRLNLDFRYELSEKTNLVQLGLNFTFQKKMLWEKKKT